MLRGALVLPNGTGRTAKVAVFCSEEETENVKAILDTVRAGGAAAAGVEWIGGKELVDTVTRDGVEKAMPGVKVRSCSRRHCGVRSSHDIPVT